MTQADRNILILQAVGYERGRVSEGRQYWLKDGVEFSSRLNGADIAHGVKFLPNFFRSLDLCEEMRQHLPEHAVETYINYLYYLSFDPSNKDKDKAAVFAKAPAHAEAFGVAMKLWPGRQPDYPPMCFSHVDAPLHILLRYARNTGAELANDRRSLKLICGLPTHLPASNPEKLSEADIVEHGMFRAWSVMEALHAQPGDKGAVNGLQMYDRRWLEARVGEWLEGWNPARNYRLPADHQLPDWEEKTRE